MKNQIVRDAVNAIEQIMLKMPQVELPVEHIFAHNVCARVLEIPANRTLSGAIHKYDNLNFLLKGSMGLVTDDGQVKELHAPTIVVAPAGSKRLASTITDCTWVTIFGTNEKDPSKIVEDFTAANDQEYLEFCKILQIEET